MKILYVDLEREWRGGQSQALLTLKGLRALGHDAELLTAEGSPIAERSKAAGIPVHTVPRIGMRGWAAQKLRSLFEEKKFAVAHLNESHALTAAWLAGEANRPPLLLSRRIGFALRQGWVSQARFRAVARFVPNSKDVAQSLRDSGIAAERISIVNEGVEIRAPLAPETRESARRHYQIAEGDFVFGCGSVFVPEKGQRHLIDAMPEVLRQYPNARLLLAGDGKCKAELEQQAARLNLQSKVLFPGFVADMDEFYAALDAFVFPSEFEGLGTALQVAMAYELPCVSTTRGALKEVVEAERTALVAEPDGRAFADAMLRLQSDAGLRGQLGRAGRKHIIEDFSAERMVRNTVAVYEQVVAEKREH